MTDSTFETFQMWLRHSITVALEDNCTPGDIAVVLREAASRLSETGYRTGEWTTVYDLPSADDRIDTRDILAQVIAGSITAGSIRYHDLELHHPGDERWASLWAIRNAETGEFLEWLNARTFRTAGDLEAYLEELNATATDA